MPDKTRERQGQARTSRDDQGQAGTSRDSNGGAGTSRDKKGTMKESSKSLQRQVKTKLGKEKRTIIKL